jgi:mRNA-degrading endonuclease RelE of RelBE toxin-antitoxin system
LDRGAARRILDRLERAATNPEHSFERLAGYDERKLRVGDYRLLAALSSSEQVITVERVDHRRRVYQR